MFPDENDRLNSWKAIAAYLERDVRTVQLWEKEQALPVYRQRHAKLSSVFAYKSELERWRLDRINGPRRSIVRQIPSNDDTTQTVLAQESAAVSGWRLGLMHGRVSRLLKFVAAGIVASIIILISIQHFRDVSHTRLPAPELVVSDAWDPRLSTDGKLLAYVSGARGDVPHIWVRQMRGEQPIQITTGSSRDGMPEFFPDSSHILFASERQGGGLFLGSTFSGEPKLVVPGVSWGRLSPDGEKILYPESGSRFIPNGTSALFVVPVKGGRRRRLEEIGDRYIWTATPSWSPSGKAVWFFGRRREETVSMDRWWMVRLGQRVVEPLSLPGIQQNSRSLGSWAKTRNGQGWMLYSVTVGTTWKLFRIRVSTAGDPEGEAQQLTSGSGVTAVTGLLGLLGGDTSMSDDGTVAFASLAYSGSLFEFHVDDRGHRLGPVTEIALSQSPLYYSPSLSRDGRWMTYSIGISGKPNKVVLYDFLTGTERILREETGLPVDIPSSLSPDGSKVIFRRSCNPIIFGDCPSLLLDTSKAQLQKICDFCTAKGFSSDGSTVLVQNYARPGKGKDRIVAIDLNSQRQREFLADAQKSLYHAYLSWDDRWVIFKRLLSVGRSEIVIAPVRQGQAGALSEWVTVTDGTHSDDKPQFSADGNTVLFTSDRDGYLCIWQQALDPVTKHPVGPATSFEHFHNAMGRDGATYPPLQWMSDLIVARNKIVIALPRIRNDIWVMSANS